MYGTVAVHDHRLHRNKLLEKMKDKGGRERTEGGNVEGGECKNICNGQGIGNVGRKEETFGGGGGYNGAKGHGRRFFRGMGLGQGK